MALSSRFEVGSSSTTIPNPTSEDAIFFIRFDQPETNDLDPADLWGAGAPYVDFHGFGSLGSASLIWRQCTIAVGTSCRGFLLADLGGSTSSSY